MKCTMCLINFKITIIEFICKYIGIRNKYTSTTHNEQYQHAYHHHFNRYLLRRAICTTVVRVFVHR